jgi:hypothetical protein
MAKHRWIIERDYEENDLEQLQAGHRAIGVDALLLGVEADAAACLLIGGDADVGDSLIQRFHPRALRAAAARWCCASRPKARPTPPAMPSAEWQHEKVTPESRRP